MVFGVTSEKISIPSVSKPVVIKGSGPPNRLIEIDGEDPLTFCWSDAAAANKEGALDFNERKKVITFDWQSLSNGLEIRFKSILFNEEFYYWVQK